MAAYDGFVQVVGGDEHQFGARIGEHPLERWRVKQQKKLIHGVADKTVAIMTDEADMGRDAELHAGSGARHPVVPCTVK